jgi:hypothetical protein
MEASNDDVPIRGEVRTKDHRRVAHGLFVEKRDGLSDADELLRDLRAWLLVLPPTAVFTHLTAVLLYGWDLPTLPEQLPVWAAVQGDGPRPRRPGLICSRLKRATEKVVRQGLPVDRPEEVLLRCARDLGHLDLAIIIESALRSGDIDQDRMEALLATRRPGVAALRAAYRAATGRPESAGEVVLVKFHELMDVPVECQVDCFDDDGTLIGRADLLVVGTRQVHEYDGAGHRDVAQHRKDLRRDRRWASSSYVRRGYTLDDLLNHAGTVMHELDRLLGRPHDPERLRRWRRLVSASLYSEEGRARVMNRWRREMGVVDWARTA